MNDKSIPNNLEDKTLFCQDCEKPFTFSAGEQQYYFDRELSFPKRCPNCRLARKLGYKGGQNGNRQ